MAYTWEKYDLEVAERFPVRNALKKMWGWLAHWLIEKAWYWTRTHTYNRYHLLDLRAAEPENSEGYRWGYLDPCSKMELAMFLCLREYIRHGNPMGGVLTDPATWDSISTEELERVGGQKWAYDETMALWSWWVRDRFVERDEQMARWRRWRESSKDAPDHEELKQSWLDSEHAEDVRKEEMLVRLARLCPHLWS